MAIENQVSQVAYDTDGVSAAFPTTFPILEGESVQVIEEVLSSGATTPLALNADYSVQQLTGGGLVLAIGGAPPAGRRWHLIRVTKAVQPVVLPAKGALPSARLESTVDRQAMVAQENRRDMKRALSAPAHEPNEMALPNVRGRAEKLLAFDADGQPFAPGFTTEQVAAVIDTAQLMLLAGSRHSFTADGTRTVYPLPAEWGLIYAAVSLLVNIGGVGGQTTAYNLTDGALYDHPGRTVIVFADPLPSHVRVEVRIPPAATAPAVNDDTEILARDSSVPRSLRDRFGQVSNPLDEGADKSGVADSRMAFVLCLARGGHIDVPPGLYRIGAVDSGDAALTMDVQGTTLNLMAGAVLAFDGAAAASDMLRITASNCVVSGAGKVTSTAFDDALWGTDGVQAAKLSTTLIRVQTDGGDIQNVKVQVTLLETNGYGLYVNTPAAHSIYNLSLDIQASRCFVPVQIAGGQAANPGAMVAGVKFAPGSRIVDTAAPAAGTYNGTLGGNAVSLLYQVQDIDLSGVTIDRSGRIGVEVYTGPDELAAGLMARNVRVSKCAITGSQYRNLSIGGSGITLEDSRIVGYVGGTQARDYIEIAGDTYTIRNLDLTASGLYAPPPSGNYLSRVLIIDNVTLRSAANGNGSQVLRAFRWAGVVIANCTVGVAHAVAAGVAKYPAIQVNGCINADCRGNRVSFSGAADLDYGIEFVRVVGGTMADNRVECIGLANEQIYAPYAVRALGGVQVAGNVTRSDNGATFGAGTITDSTLSGSGLLWRWSYVASTWTRTACNAAILAAPPGSPANGTVYVVGDNPSGLWAGQPRSFAVTADAGSSWTHAAISDVLLFDQNSPYAGDEAALPRDTTRSYLLATNGLINVDWFSNDFSQSNTLKGAAATPGLVLNASGSPYGLLWNFTYRDNTDVVAITDADIGLSVRRILAGQAPQQAAADGGTIGSATVPLRAFVAAGTVALPGVFVGGAGNGFYAFDAAGSEIAGIGISLPANGGTGRRGLEVTGTGTGAVWVRPSPAETATSTGRILRQMGGAGGETSGKGGLYQSIGGLPKDGDGGNWSGGGHDGVGTNRTGGTTTLGSGSGTGTAAAGTLTIQTGTGAAAEMTISNRTPGGITMRTDNTSRWVFTGSSYSPIPNGTLLPAANGTYSFGTLAQAALDVFGNNAYTTTSDARLKSHAEFVAPEFARAVVMGTPIAHWTWLDGGPTDEVEHYEDVPHTDPETGAVTLVQVPVYQRRAGVRWHASPYAQDLRDALGPEAAKYAAFVQSDPSDPESTLGIRQGEMAAYVHRLVQEHEQQIDALNQALTDALSRIAALEEV